ncbi:MAG TPA: hypothetical protein VM143_07330 [Acidimicrobiales bacterium]|nr:hypothetical protein [Acidimicrobiales bacterium]
MRRWRAGVLAALAALLGTAGIPRADAQVTCRITSADAFFYADTLRGDVQTYYAQVIMYTDRCGISPAEIQATFRPVAGTPATCDFRGTLLSEYAMCQGAQGVAAAGTQVVIDAVGRTYGTAGADLFSSSCTLVVTPLPAGEVGVGVGTSASRSSCPLPLE